ncbi:MAG: TonB-dependent receptor [Bacteroidales bacterium]|nr:TonB-dependent receptor [Bacteroidales bacterium]
MVFGADVKTGKVDGGDYYQTSEDVVKNAGTISSGAVYLQDEWKLFTNKLNITGGIRIDHVRFFDGEYSASGNLIERWNDYSPEFKEHSWDEISPKLALKILPQKNISGYLSWSKGFRASILDDLCRSGWMWVGPKIANPELGPEKIHHVEFGMDFGNRTKFIFSPTIYYSLGTDFYTTLQQVIRYPSDRCINDKT